MNLRTAFSRTVPSILLLLASIDVARAADAIEREVLAGVEQLYNVRFDAAASAFDRAIALDRSDPRGYFFRANVHLWSYLFDRREEQLARYMAASDRAIATARARLDRNPKDNVARLFLGMTYGYRAISNARAENIMAAALAAKTCYDQLGAVVRDDPKLVDAYLGLGIFHYIFGAVPAAAQVVVGMGGIRGDAALGIKEIETVANRGTYFRTDARMIAALLTIYHRNDLERGLEQLESLARRYPANVLLPYAIGSAYVEQGHQDRAMPYFERVVRVGSRDFKSITTMSVGRLGIAYFSRNEFVKAAGYIQRFLRTSDEKLFRPYAWYLLGVCNEMQGRRDLAVKAYERVGRSAGITPEDRMAGRRAAALLKAPMSPTDRSVLRALNAASSRLWGDAEREATAVLRTTGASAAQIAQAHFALGQARQGRGDCRAAIESYAAAIRAPRHAETWVAPFSHFHSAECWLKLGDRKKYRQQLDAAAFFKGYDREPSLRFKMQRDITTID